MTIQKMCDVCHCVCDPEETYRIGIVRNRGWTEKFFHVCTDYECIAKVKRGFEAIFGEVPLIEENVDAIPL